MKLIIDLIFYLTFCFVFNVKEFWLSFYHFWLRPFYFVLWQLTLLNICPSDKNLLFRCFQLTFFLFGSSSIYSGAQLDVLFTLPMGFSSNKIVTPILSILFLFVFAIDPPPWKSTFFFLKFWHTPWNSNNVYSTPWNFPFKPSSGILRVFSGKAKYFKGACVRYECLKDVSKTSCVSWE